jgi:folate-binding protein YgfZ
MPMITIAEAIDALRAGQAFADLTRWRKVMVTGSEAGSWLNDLLSADLADLGPGRAHRSLLLSPKGRIRADVTVAGIDGGFLLVQDPGQPGPIDRLLTPYVLSSDVALHDQAGALTLLAFPGSEPPLVEGGQVLRPSCLGPGADLVVPSTSGDAARRAVAGLVEAGPDALEAWRIQRGAARFGVDLREESLPQEADLDDAVAYEKGCFLGQEAMAKVRNLGHPPFRVLAVRATSPVAGGEPVLADGTEVGEVTSAADLPGEPTAGIVRVRWAARGSALRTAAGVTLDTLGPASGRT